MNQKRLESLAKAADLLDQVYELVESARDEEQEALENLPETFDPSDWESNVDELDTAISGLDDAQQVLDTFREEYQNKLQQAQTLRLERKYQQQVIQIFMGNNPTQELIHFIRFSNKAQEYLENSIYDEELEYILNHDDYDIANILEQSHTDFYDSEYGNSDPLCGLRDLSDDLFWALMGGEDCPNPEETMREWKRITKKQQPKEENQERPAKAKWNS